MFDQSLERISGRTGQEWLFTLLFGACLFFLITAGFWSYSYLTEKLVYEQNPIKGRLLVGQAMYNEHLKTWETDESAALLTERLMADLKKEDYEYRFITSKSLADPQQDQNSDRKDAELELAVVKKFVDAALEPSENLDAPEFEERLLPADNKYQYYQPIYADASVCVTCHNTMGDTALWSPPSGGGELTGGPRLKAGDLMAIAKITIPFPHEETQEALYRNRACLVATAMTVLLGVFISYFVLRCVIIWLPNRLRKRAV